MCSRNRLVSRELIGQQGAELRMKSEELRGWVPKGLQSFLETFSSSEGLGKGET